VHLSYFVPARDETTERDVDPMRVLLVDDHWYLEGWCRRAEDVRLFRLDRVDAITLLDLPAEVPAAAAERDLAEGLFIASPDDIPVILELAPPAHWVADYYAVDQVDQLGDDLLLVRLRVADDAWLRQLACASAARCGCSTRPSWPRTWQRPLGAPWRPTPLSDPVSVTQMAL
jgi:proteasome accessory factor C